MTTSTISQVGFRNCSAFPPRLGLSLLEVMISMLVLTIGLLGIAALISLGRVAIVETGKADRSAACGHAALNEIKIRRMLDYNFWSDRRPAENNQSFAIDPVGVADGLPANLGGATGPISRITLLSRATASTLSLAEADRIFRWRDELLFALPEDMEPPPSNDSDRPRATDPSGIPESAGNYTWLVTVTPAAAEAKNLLAEKTLYSVSVVVCYKREFSPDGEHTARIAEFYGNGWGGGGVKLDPPIPADPPLKLRKREWIMLSGGRQCKWYRIVFADREDPPQLLTLAGPDWDTTDSPNPIAVMIDHVVGVYTTTVKVESSLLWPK